MSDRKEIDHFAAALESVRQSYNEIDLLKAQVENFDRHSAILHHENELVRKECARYKRKADLYQRAYVSLKAKMAAITAVVDDALKDAEQNIYSGQPADERPRLISDDPSKLKFLANNPQR
jgi:hypothetical protein